MATKKVTFVQAKDNAGVRKVRIDDVEVDVVSAMPTIINGQIAVTMTLVGVRSLGRDRGRRNHHQDHGQEVRAASDDAGPPSVGHRRTAAGAHHAPAASSPLVDGRSGQDPRAPVHRIHPSVWLAAHADQ